MDDDTLVSPYRTDPRIGRDLEAIASGGTSGNVDGMFRYGIAYVFDDTRWTRCEPRRIDARISQRPFETIRDQPKAGRKILNANGAECLARIRWELGEESRIA